MLTNSAGNLAKERRNIRNLAARQVDGVVLSSVLMEPDLADLESADVPAVLLNHSADAPGFNSVAVDMVSGAKSAVEHLIGHGHTNIALAMGTNTGNYFDGKEQGWLQALAEAGPPESPIVRSPFTRDGGYTTGRRVLVSASLRALHEAGLSIPDDIAMASFDGSAEAEYSWPPLTTVSQPAGNGRGCCQRPHRSAPRPGA